MSMYTAADFANARFAEHPESGGVMARTDPDGAYPWVDRYGACRDFEMADRGWVPVPAKPTITESEKKERFEGANADYMWGFHEALDCAGIDIVPAPEPTNAELLADDIREVDGGHNLGAGVLAERLASLGWVKAPGGNDE